MGLGRPHLLLIICAILVASWFASAAVVHHTFRVKETRVKRLCWHQVITAVNGKLPGPTLKVKEGDTLIVHVINNSPYNITIHWHGVFQKLSNWMDGPEFVTQCPIVPGNKFTYKFNVTRQEGTVWWHAHSSFLRATVHGGVIIRPRSCHTYPFPKPYREYPIILGEWWNSNVVDVERNALETGGGLVPSDAFTINGHPGDLYDCSAELTHKIKVRRGKTYLLRIVNAALNANLFYKIANHKFTVVAVDASYTDPYVTDVVVLAPGQTADVLFTADQKPGLYYMAARPYYSLSLVANNGTTTGILAYEGAAASTSNPRMPELPALNDTATAQKFFSGLTGLVTSPFWRPVPRQVDEDFFVTIGYGLATCEKPGTCVGPFGQKLANSINNASFRLPTRMSMLQAFYENVDGIYTSDFPKVPPVKFDYTNQSNSENLDLIMTTKSTKAIKVKYNSTVQMVLQNTALLGEENHPMHLHGYNFYVLAQGFGNYDVSKDIEKFNLVNPQELNNVGVPVGGWVVIRFRADNPGIWFFHCHVDVHMPWGLAMAFVVENGATHSTTLPPPPHDYPKC